MSPTRAFAHRGIAEPRARILPAQQKPLAVFICLAGLWSATSCEVLFPSSGIVDGTVDSSRLYRRQPVILEDDHVLGADDATLTVVEYWNFSDEDCGRFARQVFPGIREQYVDTGLVRWVFRSVGGDASGTTGAIAAECAADQGAFFEFRDRVFEDTSDLSEEALIDDAAALGLDAATFEACLTGEGKDVRVDQDVNSAIAFGFTVTPSFIVDGLVLSGFQTAEDLARELNRALEDLD